MDQQNGVNINSNTLNHWNQHLTELDLMYNILTNEQIHRHHVIIQDQKQLTIYNMRIHENFPYICRVVYYHPQNENNPQLYSVYTQLMLPISHWRNNTSLIIMEGFKKLRTNYGPFRVEINMIGQNQRGQIKVWLHSNPVINYAQNPAQNQEQMLADIANIFMKYDKHSASLLMGCRTFKDGIIKITKYFEQQKVNYTYRMDQFQDNENRSNSNILFNQNAHEFWTMRNANEDRYFISQGKKRHNPFQMQIPTRNINLSVKHTQTNIGKANYPNYQFIPGTNFAYNKVGSPKMKLDKDAKNIEIHDKLKSNNSSLNDKNYINHQKESNKYAFTYQRNKQMSKSPNYQPRQQIKRQAQLHQRIQQRKKYTTIQQNKREQYCKIEDNKIQYKSSLQQVNENDGDHEYHTNKHDLNENEQEPTYRKDQKMGGVYYQNYSKNRRKQNDRYCKYNLIQNDRLQTFANPNDLLKYSANMRYKTQQFDKLKNNFPSFLPRRKQVLLSDNLSNDDKKNQNQQKNQTNNDKILSQGSDFYNGCKLEKKTSGTHFMLKKQIKSSERPRELLDQKLLRRQQKQQKIIEKLERQKKEPQSNQLNQKITKKEINLNNDVNIQGHSRYSSNQETKNAKVQDISSSMTKSSWQEAIKNDNKLQTKAQSMENSASLDDSKQQQHSDSEAKKKTKQEMALQIKKEFRDILWNNQQLTNIKPQRQDNGSLKSNNQLNKNNEKYLQVKLESTSVGKTKYEQKRQQNQKLNRMKSKNIEKDQQIKQKVEMKKATFAELKSQANKLLFEDNYA